MKQVRIGIVGCGELARTAQIPSLARIPAVEIAALCDSDSAAARSCSALAPAAGLYARADDLFASCPVDAVVISLPTHLHTEAAVAAFRAGAHVYLEKPIASRIEDAHRIMDAWRESNKVGMIGHSYRFNPLVRKLKERVAAGDIGAVVSVRTRFATPAPPQESWRRRRDTGGGALLDLAVHHVDLLRFVLGCEIASVSARIESRNTEHDYAVLSLKMASGAAAAIEVAFGEAFQDRIEFHGETGTLWIDRSHSVDVGWASTGDRIGLASIIRAHVPTPSRVAYFRTRRSSPFHEPSFAIALLAFVEAATTGIARAPDLYDGLASLAVIIAAEQSSASRAPVSVSESKRHPDVVL